MSVLSDKLQLVMDIEECINTNKSIPNDGHPANRKHKAILSAQTKLLKKRLNSIIEEDSAIRTKKITDTYSWGDSL
jgi:hypothetical protein